MADPRLRAVARHAEITREPNQAHCSVVLHVHGIVICGDVVSEKEHVRNTVEMGADIPKDVLAKLTYDGISAEHIYLSDVTYLVDGQMHTCPILTVELSSVDAWAFGALQTV